MYSAELLASLFPAGRHYLPVPSATIRNVCIDSRKASWLPDAIFIAMQGARTDGHLYIRQAWDQGIRNFLVSESIDSSSFPEANYIKVDNVINAFQTLATFHRQNYQGTVFAIIGSNGKTWVKEWLNQLMASQYSVYRSPGSFNSQVGVPLSVWNIPLTSSFAIIEAGISHPDEMERLENIIRPDIVVFTHLGDAHDEGFGGDTTWKLNEKLLMCNRARSIVFPEDESIVSHTIHKKFSDKNRVSWSLRENGSVNAKISKSEKGSLVQVRFHDQKMSYEIPFQGPVPVNNSLACFTALVAAEIQVSEMLPSFSELPPIDMRLKAEEAIQNCILINDSYSLDLDSLQYALESMDIAGAQRFKTLILSDHAFGRPGLYENVAKMITGAGIDKLICIGSEVGSLTKLIPHPVESHSFKTVDEFLKKGGTSDLFNEVILLKGARKFEFERIARILRLRSHSAVLHVDFQALDHNLRYFYKLLRPGVKKIVVVKANAYGAGSLEVCRFLSWQHVDMLAVAVIDEGIELREAGIATPVIVLNPDPGEMELVLQYDLEPEIYNRHVLLRLLQQCELLQRQAVIHIKLDSGTHRLGFSKNDLAELIGILNRQPWIKVGTIFSHLSASDDPKWDGFTHEQAKRFDDMYETLTSGIGYRPPRHVLSTSGIMRFPEYQYDAVRMGIGLYGVGMSNHPDLMPVHSLRAKILHIQRIEPGESVSYGRSFITDKPRTIATVNLGYADGLPRIAGDAGCTFLVHGALAPITGRVCMDMTMIDISHIPETQIGDEAIIFDKEHRIGQLAEACGTIPYEILTHLNPRIRKVYEHG